MRVGVDRSPRSGASSFSESSAGPQPAPTSALATAALAATAATLRLRLHLDIRVPPTFTITRPIAWRRALANRFGLRRLRLAWLGDAAGSAYGPSDRRGRGRYGPASALGTSDRVRWTHGRRRACPRTGGAPRHARRGGHRARSTAASARPRTSR